MPVNRPLMKLLSKWLFASCIVFLMTFNFYVNVLIPNDTFIQEGRNGYHSNSRSRFVWVSEHNRNDSEVHSLKYTTVKNTSVKRVLDLPPTVFARLHTTAQSVSSQLWPSLNHYSDDRISAQLEYTPVWANEHEFVNKNKMKLKTILLYHGLKDWDVKLGQQTFLEQKCPVNTCELTDKRQYGKSADAVLFRQIPKQTIFKRPPSQVWILFLLESPDFTVNLKRFRGQFNWTATYRHDSDIVTPYEKFVKHKMQPANTDPKQTRNYAAGKTKKVAWFVSNCNAANQRLEYARELSKYIEVDIIGKCGDKKCPRNMDACLKLLDTDYKFYLSFENSNCRDYITEKFFHNGLQHDVIPIVMGAAPEDYRRVAPHYSHIHVDEYTGPKQLAEYLHQLDANDDHYNEYFKWKGTGSFINTYFWCRVCAMLHDNSRDANSYGDLQEWWGGKDVCIGKQRWGERPRTSPYISNYHYSLK